MEQNRKDVRVIVAAQYNPSDMTELFTDEEYEKLLLLVRVAAKRNTRRVKEC